MVDNQFCQGADHTAGNALRYNSLEKDLDELLRGSLEMQINVAANDSIGFCMFGGIVAYVKMDFITSSINSALGTRLEPAFFSEMGRETLRLERAFNQAAGFTAVDDELPAFFYSEPLPPTSTAARFHGEDVHDMYASLEGVDGKLDLSSPVDTHG